MFANRLQKLKPYVPGEQPKDRPYTKLNANENPYPPSSNVEKALHSFDASKLNLYPDPDSNELKEAIAKSLNRTGGTLYCKNKKPLPFEVTKDMIFCGNGSDEVLSFVFYAFFDESKPVVIPEHTYSFYPVYAGFYGIPLEYVPLNEDFSINVDKMLEKDSSGIIFANPNAPTSLFLGLDKIRTILDKYPKDKIVVVDEAYIDFGNETVLPLLKEYENLVIVRTFSKSMAFAGMRLGYVIANPPVINALTTVKNSFNHFPVDRICQTIGKAACDDIDYYCDTARKISETRDWFCGKLREKGYKVLESATNFAFVSHRSLSGLEVYNKIKEAGFLVRYFNIKGITDYVRVSIGTQKQMEELFSIFEKL